MILTEVKNKHELYYIDEYNRKQGLYKQLFKRKIISQFTYVDNELHGPYECIDTYSTECGTYVHGKLEGEYIRRYISGQLQQRGHYKNGIKHGDDILYNHDGSISNISPYVNGTIHGFKIEYYYNGNIYQITEYCLGRKVNEVISWNSNNTIRTRYMLFNGKLHGEIKYYDRFGEVSRIEHYDEDRPVGRHVSFSNGKLRSEYNYESGIRHGLSVEYDDSENVVSGGNFVKGVKHGEFLENGKRTYYSNGNKINVPSITKITKYRKLKLQLKHGGPWL